MIRPDFVNHRMPGESFKAYRARRLAVNRAIELHLRGRLAFKSSEPVFLPLLGVDPALDEQIRRGNIRDVKLFNPPVALPWPHGPRHPKPAGKQVRIGRTKGETFCHYPEGRHRAEWREIERRLVA